MNNIQLFDNEDFGTVRAMEIEGKPYFVADDVARALGYSDAPKAIRTHCKGVDEIAIPTNDGEQVSKIIPEGDVYRLIFRSKLPTAEKFETWVVEEVLPTIRKTGGYQVEKLPSNDFEVLERMFNVIKDQREKLQVHEDKLNFLIDTTTISFSQQQQIQEAVSKAVYEYTHIPGFTNKLFSDCCQSIKRHFHIPRYNELAKKDFEECIELINIWLPRADLRLEIEQAERQSNLGI